MPAAARRISADDLGMLLVCLIWGMNFSVTKSAFDQLAPLPFTAIRFVVSSLLLWVIIRIAEGPAKLPPGALRQLVILGVLGNTFYQLVFMLGLARTTATNSALILSTVPTVVAVFAGVRGLERITPRMRWGIALGTVGVVLVIAIRGVGFDRATLIGDLLTVAAVLFWAGYTLGLRRVPESVSPLRVTTITTLAGMPGLVLAGLPGVIRLDWPAVNLHAWLAVAYSSIFSLVVAYLLWNRSVKAIGGTRTAIYMCLTPVVAVFGAWLLLGERPHALQGVGAIFIIVGVLLTRTGGESKELEREKQTA
ncbi:MAG: DMT family transporter [Methyloceanibacter sp.]|uniref:DMT family transporter n=1 Tax=Methyloceanibacter sp. TaxID=1965321 RepID=UPI003D9B59BA